MTPLASVKRLVIHHSASPRETTVEQIREWHKARGFADVGYHRVIDQHGTVHATRQLTVQGAHAVGANSDSWGFCVTGDNTREDRRWNEAQIASLERLVDAACELVPGLVVCGHRDVPGAKTECPGLSVRELLGV